MPDVNSEGFSTTVQPLPIAQGTRSEAMMKGKFQGVMMPTTPTGSRRTRPKTIVADIVVGLAFQRAGLAGGVGPEIRAETDFAARLSDWLANLETLDQRQSPPAARG